MTIRVPERSASQNTSDFILVDICRHRQISTTFHFSWTRYKSNVPWQHVTVIQREKDHVVITTFLTIKAMRRAAKKLVKLIDMNRGRGEVCSDMKYIDSCTTQ